MARGAVHSGDLAASTTRKGKTVYVHVLKWYDDRIVLPPISHKILSHAVLTGGDATVEQDGDGVEIAVPAEHRRELDTIIALELDGPAMELDVAPIRSGPLTFGKQVTASHVYDADPNTARNYRPEYAVDGDPMTGWTFNRDQPTAWLEVDLGSTSDL